MGFLDWGGRVSHGGAEVVAVEMLHAVQSDGE